VSPDEDVAQLHALGAADVFRQETPPDDIVSRIRALVVARGSRRP
jgi:methylmalonyl-CoA mutase cobalamin-binding subunit